MTALRTILCPVDFSPLSDQTMQVAAALSQRFGARLVLHHNVKAGPPDFLTVNWMWSEEFETGLEKEAAEAPERLRALFEKLPMGLPFEAKVSRGPLDAAVLYLAKELPADLVVMGSHGSSDAAHKSLTERVIMRAPCTVLTTGESYSSEKLFAPRGAAPERLSVMVPVDFTGRSRAALDFALSLAKWMPHELHVVHVVKPHREAKEDQECAEALELLEEWIPADGKVRTSAHVLRGKPSEEILKYAKEAEVLFIVMAAHKKGAVSRTLFGTTTLEVLHGADRPVWFVPERAHGRLDAPAAAAG